MPPPPAPKSHHADKENIDPGFEQQHNAGPSKLYSMPSGKQQFTTSGAKGRTPLADITALCMLQVGTSWEGFLNLRLCVACTQQLLQLPSISTIPGVVNNSHQQTRSVHCPLTLLVLLLLLLVSQSGVPLKQQQPGGSTMQVSGQGLIRYHAQQSPVHSTAPCCIAWCPCKATQCLQERRPLNPHACASVCVDTCIACACGVCVCVFVL